MVITTNNQKGGNKWHFVQTVALRRLTALSVESVALAQLVPLQQHLATRLLQPFQLASPWRSYSHS
jgi:hypothetical protein